MTPAWILLKLLDLKDHISGKIRASDKTEDDAHSTASTDSQNTLHAHVQDFERRFYNRIERMHKDFLIDRSQATEDETPMDKATSAMLLWMITNCEDPKSVDLALQALAGADLWLPCKAFSQCEIDAQVLRKLERCLYVLESPHLRSHGIAWEGLLDSAYLYSRALATLIRGAPENPKVPGVSWHEWEICMRRMHKILDGHAKPRNSKATQAPQSTDFEFGTLLLGGSRGIHTPDSNSFHSKQIERQWQLLEQITTNQVTGLPPSAASVRALVNVITQTLLYAPRSPLPLIELFNAYNISHIALGSEDATLGHAIGIALTVARFVDNKYTPVRMEDQLQQRSQTMAFRNSGATLSRHEHAQRVYSKLATKQPTHKRTRALLTFGLLGLLELPEMTEDDQNRAYLKQNEIESIQRALQTLEAPQMQLRQSTLLTHSDQSLRYLEYHKLMPLTPLTFDLEDQFRDIVRGWLGFWVGDQKPGHDQYLPASPSPDIVTMHLEALLSLSRCQLFGTLIIDDLITLIIPEYNSQATANQEPGSHQPALFPVRRVALNLRAKKLCIRSVAYSIAEWPGSSRHHKQESHTVINKLNAVNFRGSMESLVESGEREGDLVPYAMRFLWNFASTAGKSGTLHQETRVASDNNHRLFRPIGARIPGSGSLCVRNGEFESQWFETIRRLCKDNPINILESGILDELTKPCEDKCYEGYLPHFTVIDSFNPPLVSQGRDITWLDVYKSLKTECEASVAQTVVDTGSQTQESNTVTVEPETAILEISRTQPSVEESKTVV
ncbi:similar to Txn-coupled DNA repair ATPase-helicase [Rhizoctonia solani AG-1 IB]|uniref:Similar to Txn-coupled DNA repair ATPase-helicase n=1 Tax=Thanatephorus cucumeris (strain AG1-IB / isolate 7/3/14) TaxID=1108050 RepID=A0A0B7FRC3_THACB|nr:similar to Txn-coupled DNA repair ATPase-helicase [Rhizoctonia solani AG-1 IB]